MRLTFFVTAITFVLGCGGENSQAVKGDVDAGRDVKTKNKKAALTEFKSDLPPLPGAAK
jgi:hypothetical protein